MAEGEEVWAAKISGELVGVADALELRPGDGVGDDVLVGLGVGDLVGVGLGVLVEEGEGVGVEVGVAVGVGVGVGVGESVGGRGGGCRNGNIKSSRIISPGGATAGLSVSAYF